MSGDVCTGVAVSKISRISETATTERATGLRMEGVRRVAY